MAAAGSLVGAAGLALQVAGTVQSEQTAKKAAAARQAAAEFEAEQLEQNAGQTVAAAQRQAFETGRTGAYTASRALAVSAASGGGASDPTVMNNIAQLASETAYRKSLDLYQGEERARQLNLSAAATRQSGKIASDALLAQGDAAVIQGATGVASTISRAYRPTTAATGSSMFSTYGYGGPVYTGGTPTDPAYG